jgi:hypothetical protein
MFRLSIGSDVYKAILNVISVPQVKYISLCTFDKVLGVLADNTEYFKLALFNINDDCNISYRVPVECIRMLLCDGDIAIMETDSELIMTSERIVSGRSVVLASCKIVKEISYSLDFIKELYAKFNSGSSKSFEDFDSVKVMSQIASFAGKKGIDSSGIFLANRWIYTIGDGFRAYKEANCDISLQFTNDCISQLIKFSGTYGMNVFETDSYNICEAQGVFFGWRKVRENVDGEIDEFLSCQPISVYEVATSQLLKALKSLSNVKKNPVKCIFNLDENRLEFQSKIGTFNVLCPSELVSGKKFGVFEMPFDKLKGILLTKLNFTGSKLSIFSTFFQFTLPSGLMLLIERTNNE